MWSGPVKVSTDGTWKFSKLVAGKFFKYYIYLNGRVVDTKKVRWRERCSRCWFIPQMAAVVGAGCTGLKARDCSVFWVSCLGAGI